MPPLGWCILGYQIVVLNLSWKGNTGIFWNVYLHATLSVWMTNFIKYRHLFDCSKYHTFLRTHRQIVNCLMNEVADQRPVFIHSFIICINHGNVVLKQNFRWLSHQILLPHTLSCPSTKLVAVPLSSPTNLATYTKKYSCYNSIP